MRNHDYKVTVGLEIHAELKTRTKMFCDSKNDPDERRPNINICPICLGYPGTLPTPNFEAIRHVVRVGVAVGGTIADYTEFDRKNYFYPDIPKGYQISQYAYPLVKGGMLAGVALTRIHLEEDTARSTHDDGAFSLVDFNRAGIPLMELVTEPVIHSAEEASRFAKELQLLLQTLQAGDANMEKGEMRVEANISISRTDTFGTKVEVKNLNSFRSVEKAISYEIDRHIGLLERGEKVLQETRGWDEEKGVTFSQRTKEDSHDYRYFPDPDLPKMKLSEVRELLPDSIRQELPELPWEKRDRLFALGLKSEDREFFVRSSMWGEYLEQVFHALGKSGKSAAKLTAVNYITSDLAGLVRGGEGDIAQKITPQHFAKLIGMVEDNRLSSRAAKDLLKMMYEEDSDPETLAEKRGLLQKSDVGELGAIVEKVIQENPDAVAEYKAGKTTIVQFLVGQTMRATKGAGNPAVLKDLIISTLDK